MGGSGKFPYPKWVWSTTGGWWPQPAQWKINTGVMLIWSVALSIPVFIYSKNHERVVEGPRRDDWVPSMLWSKDLIKRTEMKSASLMSDSSAVHSNN